MQLRARHPEQASQPVWRSGAPGAPDASLAEEQIDRKGLRRQRAVPGQRFEQSMQTLDPQRAGAAGCGQRRARAVEANLDPLARERKPDAVAVLVHGVQLAAQVEHTLRAGAHLLSGMRLLMRSAPLNFHTA